MAMNVTADLHTHTHTHTALVQAVKVLLWSGERAVATTTASSHWQLSVTSTASNRPAQTTAQPGLSHTHTHAELALAGSYQRFTLPKTGKLQVS